MPCLVCGEVETVAAHVFPRALIHDMKDDAQHINIAQHGSSRFEFTQSGPFDPNILCGPCEGKLSGCDDYAVKWIRTFERKATLGYNGLAYTVPNPKPDLLVKFAVSVVWRASVAARTKNKDNDLGPWEYAVRKWLFEGRHLKPSVFVARKRWTAGGEHHGDIAVDPYWATKRSRRTYIFEIGGFQWGVKLDQRGSWLEYSEQFRANGKDPLLVLNMKHAELTEDAALMGIFESIEAQIARAARDRAG